MYLSPLNVRSEILNFKSILLFIMGQNKYDIKLQNILDLMQENGFSYTIFGEGVEYFLPSSVFTIESEKSNEDILNTVKELTKKLKRPCRILSIQSNNRRWYALENVRDESVL